MVDIFIQPHENTYHIQYDPCFTLQMIEHSKASNYWAGRGCSLLECPFPLKINCTVTLQSKSPIKIQSIKNILV